MKKFKIIKKLTNKYESKSLNNYLQEISNIPLLKKEEEKKLAKIISKGKNNKNYKIALKKLVNSNLRFVVSVAKQYQNQGLSLLDLINEGNLGLIKAASRFDYNKGYKFISYAVWWIRQCILQAIADYSRCVRSPTNKIAFLNKINKISIILEHKYNRKPTIKEIAKYLSTDEKNVEEVIRNSGKHISLDAPLIEGEDINLYDILHSKESNELENKLNIESLNKDIKKCFKILSKREKKVIILYCGLFKKKQMTFEEIAKIFNLTRERVRQIQISALIKLKNNKYCKNLKNYLG
ncbi:MAG: sigma-70 family RNA polymerase sigma factor [Candidatus Shikimatogenerans bostrichidophilus]|nr:MAG: sigma-70 family RNA polymerase sigma factor [Candidatus Shikimatogenerans bostrichidophilus]